MNKLINYVLKHRTNLIYLIVGLVLGYLVGIISTYYFGVNIGGSKIFHNGSGTCISNC